MKPPRGLPQRRQVCGEARRPAGSPPTRWRRPRPPTNRQERPPRVAAAFATLLLGLVPILTGCTGDVVATETSSATDSLRSTIDLPAENRVVPADAVVNVKTAYGAAGDGRTDDTSAIQTAISANLGYGGRRDKILYFPAGTYLVTRPLEWRLADGAWSTWLTIMGQNRDQTVIRLADSAAGFSDPAHPQAVIVTGSQNADGPDGSGNQAFSNFIFDLTVDVGTGNPGANGIDYMANNRGAIRNVIFRAAQDSGNAGISMTRKWPGPALLEDVRISGFDRGIAIGQSEYSITAENIRLSGQRTVGIDNQDNVLSIRDLVSDNAVLAVLNGQPGANTALLTLLDSDLLAGAAPAAAVENYGAAFIRGLHTEGYQAPIRDNGASQYPADRAEWSSQPSSALPGESSPTMRLPVAENPTVPGYPADQWIGANSMGARSDGSGDDTGAIQAALDSGKPVVYLRSGTYFVSHTLRVPETVRAIVGFEAQIDATRGSFGPSSSAAVFSAAEPSAEPLVISQLLFNAPAGVFDVASPAGRSIALQDVHVEGQPLGGSPSQVFLSNVEGGKGWRFTAGQQVWARQLDAEQSSGVKIQNDGASVWILGLKTERPTTVLESTNGARTELLGALLYPANVMPEGVPAFTSSDATQSLVFATSAYGRERNYDVLVDLTQNGVHKQLTSEDAPRRRDGSMVVLYTDAP